MNKIMKNLIMMAAMLSFVGTAVSQSRYYHLVGDTVYGKSPIYYYDWWPDVDSLGQLQDSAIQSIWSGGNFNLHTTTDTLKIIGIASTMSYLNIEDQLNQFEECDTTIDTAMYYTLFAATPTGPVELAKVCWTADYDTHPKRYMALPRTYSSADGDEYCNSLVVRSNIAVLREYYFNTPVIVTDSFYLGFEVLHRRDRNVWSAPGYMDYVGTHVYRNAALNQFLPSAQYTKKCTQKIPPHRMMYRRLTADSSWAYTIDSTTYPTVFAIIEIDTVGLPYDTSLFSCPVPEALTLRSRGDNWARIEWVDNSNNAEWMVSVAPVGVNPDNGRMIPSNDRNLHIYGLSPDTSYNIYVRGACTTSMWEGWSDWSAPLTLEATHTPEGISAPVCERVSLNPNPARGTVTVTTESQQGTLTIIDMQGRQMLTMPLAGSETVVDIHTLAPGTYIVTLTTPRGPSSLKLTVE